MGEDDKLIAFDKCEIAVVKDGEIKTLGAIVDNSVEVDVSHEDERIDFCNGTYSFSFNVENTSELRSFLKGHDFVQKIVERGNKMLDELRSMHNDYIATLYKYNRRERRAFERDFAKKKAVLERYVYNLAIINHD